MTRQEQIKQAGYAAYYDPYDPEGTVKQDAFEKGAEWADEHPHWISVEDELPEKGDIVIVMQDAYGNIHFTACEFISAMQLCDVTDFYVRSDAYLGITKKAEITLGAVTHWMRIPDCPPLQNFCNNLRAVLNGENEEGGEQ